MIKLKRIAEGIVSKTEVPAQIRTEEFKTSSPESKLSVEQKKKLSSMVSAFNEYGKSIYRERDIAEVAAHLHEIVELAEAYALNECGDFIEESTVKRNMMELRKYNESFNKIAKESKVRQHQLEALYEDMGRVLERYFDIN
jgi:hypothetical protein